ncbi:MAG: complex I subunit 5 family protein [Bacillota bacterium]|nr:complex I subunit 5 family protein [Bacillota bacterium]
MYPLLIVLLLLLPALSGLGDILFKSKFLSICGALLAFPILIALWYSPGSSVSISFMLPGLLLTYGAAPIGLMLASVTVVVWLAASIFSLSYMNHEHNIPRFYLLFGLSVSGAMATFLAQDFFALLLGFELMSLASYGLVAHTSTPKALRAGNIYLFLGVIGGVILSIAAAILYSAEATLVFSKLHGLPLSVTILMACGFAIKAGAFPLHFWLPEAHPVAPSPGSALLSGILIKTGAYGLLQVASLTSHGRSYGTVLIIVALVTMSLGVALALLQHDAKRLLAYHSVSQMGYILLGVGLWAYEHNALAMSGAVLHMINHALFKSALFLICGSALLSVGTVDLYKLGSMRKAFAIFTPLALIPALGIAGIPGFNGYVSKTLLHDALLHSAEPSMLLALAEKIFLLVAFGTVCSFIKFAWYMFFAKPAPEAAVRKVSTPEILSLGLLSICIISLGIYPKPALQLFSQVAHTLHGHWPEHLEIFGSHALMSAGMVLVGGTLLFFAGLYTGLFHLHLSDRFSILTLIEKVTSLSVQGSQAVSRLLGGWSAQLDAFVAAQVEIVGRSLQALDYKPSASPNLRALSVTNLTFDVYIVMGVLSILILMYPLVM